MRTLIILSITALAFLYTPFAAGQSVYAIPQAATNLDSSTIKPQNPEAIFMGADLILARPAMAVASLAGIGTYLVSLPFSFLGGNMDQAREKLVNEPLRATLQRCLGCDSNYN